MTLSLIKSLFFRLGIRSDRAVIAVAETGFSDAALLQARDEDVTALAETHFRKAALLHAQNKDVKAVERWRNGFDLTQTHIELGLEISKALLDRGDFARALAAYERLIAAKSEMSVAHYGRAVALSRQGRENEALEAYTRAFHGEPQHLEAGLKLADVRLMRGETAAALDVYRDILALDSDLAEARYGLAIVESALGRENEAIEAFRRAFYSVRPHPAAGLKLAEALLVRADAAAALPIYDQLLALIPNTAEAHYGRSIALLELGDREQATLSLRRALELKHDYPSAEVVAGLMSILSSRASRADRRTAGIRIYLPITSFLRDWLGGQIYLVNFTRILHTLPADQRPEIALAMLGRNWRDNASLRQLVESLLTSGDIAFTIESGAHLAPTKERFDQHQPTDVGEDDSAPVEDNPTLIIFPLLFPAWGCSVLSGLLFWIPDLQHRKFARNFTVEELAARERDMSALANRDVPIVFSSHDAEEQFLMAYPSRRCRTYVWHFAALGVTETAGAEAFLALGLPQRFYFTPNQFWPHKDHATLFRALRCLLDTGLDITFVCTGTDLAAGADGHTQQLRELIAQLGLGRHLRLLGVLPRALQLDVMRHACAVIQPSLFEGWSTVVEDARALGRPLILSDIPVHREQVGSGARFFIPSDPAALAAAVRAAEQELTGGPDPGAEAIARRELLERGEASARGFLRILDAEARYEKTRPKPS